MYKTPIDLCPIETFNAMLTDIKELEFDKLLLSKQKNMSFITRRDEYLKLLKKVVKKLRFDGNTMNLAAYYYDIILLTNQELKVDLLAVTCLFIAGKFTHLNLS